jgi:nitroreductase
MELTESSIKKAVIRSQHCQRNWNLEKEIPQEDLQTMVHAITNCPSKQNAAFYNVYTITDRDTIERIHEKTEGFYHRDEEKMVSNSQTLANVLFVFTNNTEKSNRLNKKRDSYGDNEASVGRDLHMATGIAAGYLNLTSSLMGYNTGCCACFEGDEIQEILNTKDEIVLLMGVGHKGDIPRRIHHADNSLTFPAIPKEDIAVTYIT